MQQKNFILFLFLSLLILIGSMQLQSWLWPKPTHQQAKAIAKAAVDAATKPKPPAEQRVIVPKAHEPGEAIQLGDERSAIRATLTDWGGGVTSVVLNNFQQADEFGKPEHVPLELVRGDMNRQTASNLLYHHDVHQDNANRPLSTLGERRWKVVEKGPEKVVFTTTLGAVQITKTFTLGKEDYHIGLEVKVKLLDGKSARKFRYQIAGAHGLRMEGLFYTNTLRDALILRINKKNGDDVLRTKDELRRLGHRMGGDEVLKTDDLFLRYAAVVTQFFASGVIVDNEQPDGKQDFIAWARATVESAWLRGKIERIDGRTFEMDTTPPAGLFGGAPRKETHTIVLGPDVQLPDGLREGSAVAVNYTLDDRDPAQKVALDILGPSEMNQLTFDDITVRLTTDAFDLEPGESVVHKYLLYNGPVKVSLLNHLSGDKAVSSELVERYTNTLKLNTFTDYQSNSFFGDIAHAIHWTQLLVFMTNVMHTILWWIHYVIPNYGLCIIVLTLLVRAAMFPLSRKQTLNAQRMQEKMAKLKPEMDKLKEKYKDDPQALNQAKTELMLRHGMVNPLGSCWIALLQMPIFMGLYYALQESIHFRLAPFLWMDNLAAPDMLFYWTQSIPIISSPDNYSGGLLSILYLGPFFNLLPIIAVGFMMVQQSMMMPPATDEQTAAQQKMMKYMTIFFGLMFYKVAAGLCIYFIVSSVWGFCERKLLPKKQPGGSPELPEPKRGRFSQWMLDRMDSIRAGQSNAVTATPPVSNGPTTNRDNRDKRKPKRPERKGASTNGTDGAFQKLRDWWDKVLKEARKK
jgi:YidC/Oxa1 family membrane protein insertase